MHATCHPELFCCQSLALFMQCSPLWHCNWHVNCDFGDLCVFASPGSLCPCAAAGQEEFTPALNGLWSNLLGSGYPDRMPQCLLMPGYLVEPWYLWREVWAWGGPEAITENKVEPWVVDNTATPAAPLQQCPLNLVVRSLAASDESTQNRVG